MSTALSVDEAFDRVFEAFAAKPNAAPLEAPEIQSPGPRGIVFSRLQTVFIPTTSPDEGVLISRLRNEGPIAFGQVESGILYMQIVRLDRVAEPGVYDALWQCHVRPPGPSASLFNMGGWAYHFTLEGKYECVDVHVIQRAQPRVDAFSGAIVVDQSLNLDPRFATVAIGTRTTYAPAVIRHLGELIYADLARLPGYEL